MRKKFISILTMLFVFLLSACSNQQAVEKLYAQESPLKIEVFIPESFSANKKETIKVQLKQDGKPLKEADYVHFEIWNQEGSVYYSMESAISEGNGIYSLSKDLDVEGLYFIKVHASNNGSIITPQKQFVVGKLTENDEKFLNKGTKLEIEGHEHHH
ncbi:FixH family protein [Metabacillus litoralis]|uniref:YtkA-like domain-containing protein n=1 Tax=Metabacillus litoralis TaxID=152268 RepID=A0A179T9R4_9BACI|nr:FixH family protein [Metabacillus litoralis]OAS89173.1 hypothetical protein A6K24_01020 [Metabacillus litoralis]